MRLEWRLAETRTSLDPVRIGRVLDWAAGSRCRQSSRTTWWGGGAWQAGQSLGGWELTSGQTSSTARRTAHPRLEDYLNTESRARAGLEQGRGWKLRRIYRAVLVADAGVRKVRVPKAPGSRGGSNAPLKPLQTPRVAPRLTVSARIMPESPSVSTPRTNPSLNPISDPMRMAPSSSVPTEPIQAHLHLLNLALADLEHEIPERSMRRSVIPSLSLLSLTSLSQASSHRLRASL
jgi:hypothetical protein